VSAGRRPEVLFVCVQNAGRSQMAAALLRKLAGDRVVVRSAGSAPASEVHGGVLAALREIGLEPTAPPRKLSDEFVRAADVVVTMGCGDACPVVPGKRYEDWKVADPAGKGLDEVRAIREDIRARVLALARRAAAEALGTALLLAAVVGSGIMGERLCGGNVAIALLANTIATGAALVALILTFGPLSGAHFNPAVTLTDGWRGGTAWRDVPAYVAAQVGGAFAGVALAHGMFGAPVFSASRHERSGGAQLLSEFVATFGLLAVIRVVSRRRPTHVPYAVGAYITAAYWFTASTSFANPAVTIARCATDTFAGIRPADVPGFVAVQLVAAFAAVAVLDWLAADAP
jgi:glycerol uptake facilitator-like aquaporin/protein-tyrosine-phosphatase